MVLFSKKVLKFADQTTQVSQFFSPGAGFLRIFRLLQAASLHSEPRRIIVQYEISNGLIVCICVGTQVLSASQDNLSTGRGDLRLVEGDLRLVDRTESNLNECTGVADLASLV